MKMFMFKLINKLSPFTVAYLLPQLFSLNNAESTSMIIIHLNLRNLLIFYQFKMLHLYAILGKNMVLHLSLHNTILKLAI